jgi:hypothetical protein
MRMSLGSTIEQIMVQIIVDKLHGELKDPTARALSRRHLSGHARRCTP